MRYLPAEPENGNIEYKLHLLGKEEDTKRLEELATQMRFRLFEGSGEAIYYLGVSDDGTPSGLSDADMAESLKVLSKVSELAGAKLRILRKGEGKEGEIAEILIRREKNPDEIPMDIRVASVGNVDAGKSTLIGVLYRGKLDDGRGAARSQVVRYFHELESGRTSSVSITVIGFDVEGNIVNHDPVHHPTDIEILENSVKTISFVDLAGHEKYLKTTVFGLTGLAPDYAMLFISANQGVLQMTKEHMGLLIALKIPFFVVLTKIDMTPEERTLRTLEELHKILKIPSVSRINSVVRDMDDVVISAQNLPGMAYVPIFPVSAVTGDGIDLLQQFLQLLRVKNGKTLDKSDTFKAYIDDIFSVSGVGTVVAAMVYSGTFEVNNVVQIGPFSDGSFRKVRVKSMHYKRVPTSKVEAGQSATFALARFNKEEVRKGMVLLDTKHQSGSTYKFDADIYVLYHSTTIKIGYSPVVHIRSIRQSAQIISADKEVIRTGDRASVTFRFQYRPEYIQEGSRIVFREGRTKGIGIVTKVYSD